MFLAIIAISAWVAAGHANEIDNHLIGEPVVDCQDNAVSISFLTEKPFAGRVFVKGLSEDDRCSKNFASNADRNKFDMVVTNGDCAMQRQRVQDEQLEGVVFSLILVVSFHGTFITKVDRAFRCMCFFRNIKRVTNILDVSMIGTTELLDTVKTPTCRYTIHSGSAEGSLTRFAKVGDKVYHVWECDDVAQGFLVHSCWVSDGHGRRFDLLDIDGCAIDSIIQPDVKYEPSLTKAIVETHGYKFADTSVLNYQCIIELCKKTQGECNGLTPPQCGRGKRDIMHVTSNNEAQLKLTNFTRSNYVELISSVDILDSLESNNVGPNHPELLNPWTSAPASPDSSRCSSAVCFSFLSLGIMVSVFSIFILSTSLASGYVWLNLRRRPSQKKSMFEYSTKHKCAAVN